MRALRTATRRRRVTVGFAGAVGIALAVLVPMRALAAGSDPTLESAAGRLAQAGDFLDNAANANQLADALPLSTIAPKDALAIADVFDDDNADPSDSLKEQLAGLGTIGDTAEF